MNIKKSETKDKPGSQAQWKQRRLKALRHWGKMMNDELAAITGKHLKELLGRLQETYSIS